MRPSAYDNDCLLFEQRYGDRVRPMVARGACLLDHVAPGWASEVDLDKLHIASCDRCVLGQLACRLDDMLPIDKSSPYGSRLDYATAKRALEHISETYQEVRKSARCPKRAMTMLGFAIDKALLPGVESDSDLSRIFQSRWYLVLTKYWAEEIEARVNSDNPEPE